MDAKNIERLVSKAKEDIQKEVTDRLPRKVGVVAVNHFKQNFRDGGWLDSGLHPWKRTRRQDSKSPDAKYGPLTSRRTHLMRSIQASVAPGQVTIENPVPYAAIHNDGGDITTHPTVTKRMRKYAWRMVYSLAGIKGKGKLPKELPPEAEKWKGLALTKKKSVTIHAHIPQRQFMGDSAELRLKVNKLINDSIKKIKDGKCNTTYVTFRFDILSCPLTFLSTFNFQLSKYQPFPFTLPILPLWHTSFRPLNLLQPFFVTLASPKLLALGKAQINLAFLSFFCNFVLANSLKRTRACQRQTLAICRRRRSPCKFAKANLGSACGLTTTLPMNIKLLYKVLGALLFLESLFMLLCLIVAAWYREDDIPSFLVSILVTQLAAYVLRYLGRDADNTMSRKDSFLMVTLTWSVFSLFGTLPFLVGGYITNFTNAYFEAISGFTTTGATIIDDVERLPHGILFWRTFSQWIGGLGIVFFTIAVLPSMVSGSMKVFSAETTGPIKTKLHPRLSTSAKSIWVIFLVLTLLCLSSYKLLGMDWFDSVNYAMTTIATGGFATHNDSISYFHSPSMEYVSTVFCFLSGLNFILLYRLFTKGDVKSLISNAEVRFYCLLTALFTAVIMLLLITQLSYDVEHAFRSALYQVVSFITTTGLFNDDAARWPHVTWLVLAVCMFTGACAGSTSGGFKCIRCTMLLRIVYNEFRQMLHPKAVLPLRFADVNVSMQRRVTLLAFLTVYGLLSLLCAFTMIAAGVDNTNAFTITVSTLSNVGPTLGTEIGPTMSWNDLPDFAKWMCSLLMLMGRLEIFSVLIIFTPTFWKDK